MSNSRGIHYASSQDLFVCLPARFWPCSWRWTLGFSGALQWVGATQCISSWVWPGCMSHGRSLVAFTCVSNDSCHILCKHLWTLDVFSIPLQVCLSRHHDFMLAIGFVLVMQCVRRLGLHSHMWIGVPCSTWVWMSRGSTRRCRLRVRGSKKVRCVRAANKFIRRLCYASLSCT